MRGMWRMLRPHNHALKCIYEKNLGVEACRMCGDWSYLSR